MALNNSGPLSMGGSTVGQSINLELGVSATALASINSTSFRTLAGVPSGQISISNFYGKSNTITLYSLNAGGIGGINAFSIYNANIDSSGNLYYVAKGFAGYGGPGKITNTGTVAWGNQIDDWSFNGWQTPACITNTGIIGVVGYKSGNLGGSNNQVNILYRAWNSSGTQTMSGAAGRAKTPTSWYPENYQFLHCASNYASGYFAAHGNGYYVFRDTYCCCCTEVVIYTPYYQYGIYVYTTTGPYNQATRPDGDNAGGGLNNTPAMCKSSPEVWQLYGAFAGSYTGSAFIQLNGVLNLGFDNAVYRGRFASSGGEITFNGANGCLTTVNTPVNDTPVAFINATYSGYGGVAVLIKGNTKAISSVSWAKSIYPATTPGGPTFQTYAGAKAITTDSANNIYVAMKVDYPGSPSYQAAFLFKFDSSGTLLWQRGFKITACNIPGYVGSYGSCQITALNYLEASSEIIASFIYSPVSTETSSAPQGLVLRLPTDGSKTGNITVPFASNAAYNTTFSYFATACTILTGGVTFQGDGGSYTVPSGYTTGSLSAPTSFTPAVATGSF